MEPSPLQKSEHELSASAVEQVPSVSAAPSSADSSEHAPRLPLSGASVTRHGLVVVIAPKPSAPASASARSTPFRPRAAMLKLVDRLLRDGNIIK